MPRGCGCHHAATPRPLMPTVMTPDFAAITCFHLFSPPADTLILLLPRWPDIAAAGCRHSQMLHAS